MLHTARSALGVLVFCAYLVVNTQMMMGGGKKRQLRPTEHIMAALTIYTDIINRESPRQRLAHSLATHRPLIDTMPTDRTQCPPRCVH